MADEEKDFYAGVGAGDLQLPKASVLKAVKEQIPKGMRVSAETGNLVMECCMEFLRMLSDEANELCSKGGKQTINPDHVMQSLTELGFEAWSAEVEKAHEGYKKAMKTKPKMGKNPMAKSGLSHEELVKAQNALMEQARIASWCATTAPKGSAAGIVSAEGAGGCGGSSRSVGKKTAGEKEGEKQDTAKRTKIS